MPKKELCHLVAAFGPSEEFCAGSLLDSRHHPSLRRRDPAPSSPLGNCRHRQPLVDLKPQSLTSGVPTWAAAVYPLDLPPRVW